MLGLELARQHCTTGLDPLPTLVAMFVGLKLFGFLGLIVGPVTIVVLTACHRANVFRVPSPEETAGSTPPAAEEAGADRP